MPYFGSIDVPKGTIMINSYWVKVCWAEVVHSKLYKIYYYYKYFYRHSIHTFLNALTSAYRCVYNHVDGLYMYVERLHVSAWHREYTVLNNMMSIIKNNNYRQITNN